MGLGNFVEVLSVNFGWRFKLPHQNERFNLRNTEIGYSGCVQKKDLSNSTSFDRCPASLAGQIVTGLKPTQDKVSASFWY